MDNPEFSDKDMIVLDDSAGMLALISERMRSSAYLLDLLDYDATFDRGEMSPGSYINAIRATLVKLRKTLPMDDR